MKSLQDLDCRARLDLVDHSDARSGQVVNVEKHREKLTTLAFGRRERSSRRPGLEVGDLGDPPPAILAVADDVAVPARIRRMFGQAEERRDGDGVVESVPRYGPAVVVDPKSLPLLVRSVGKKRERRERNGNLPAIPEPDTEMPGVNLSRSRRWAIPATR